MRLLPLFVSILFLLAVACGGAATATPVPTATPPQGNPPAATGQSAPTPTPQQSQGAEQASGDIPQGGTFVRLWAEPPTLDPHLTTDSTSAGIIVEVFGGLVTLDSSLDIVPDLAERWDVSNDGKTYTFHLRKDARFHNGKPVTAQDFKWSLERVTNPSTQAPVVDVYLGDVVGVPAKLRGEANEVSGVKVLDDHTLEFSIDAPKAYFLAKLTYPTAFVLDRENVEGNASWFRDPNGTGPFTLAEYTPGEVLRLQRNEHYHLGPPHLDEVKFILSGGDAMLMYENDEIHLTGVGITNLDSVLDPANPLNKELHQAPPSFSTYYIGMNVNQPPFDDPKVRRALNYAVDKQTISEVVLRGLLTPAKGVLPPNFPGYNPDLDGYEYNPERAKQLLAESKYGGNMANFPRVTLTLPGSFGASVGPDTEAMLETWRQTLGIEVEIQQTEWATFLQDQRQGRYQMFGGSGWVADYVDPQNFLEILLHSESAHNHTGYSNPEVDRLLEQAGVEQDEEARIRMYQRAEQMIMEDAPWIPLWHGDSAYVLIKPEVKNYKLLPMTLPKYRYVYMDK